MAHGVRDPRLDEQEVIDEIIERIVSGESIVKICADKSMPSRRSLYAEMAKNEKLCATITRAQELGQSAAVDDCRYIADSATTENYKVAELRIRTIQWEAGRRAAKRFGDRTVLAGDKDAPLGVQLIHSVPQPDRGEK